MRTEITAEERQDFDNRVVLANEEAGFIFGKVYNEGDKVTYKDDGETYIVTATRIMPMSTNALRDSNPLLTYQRVTLAAQDIAGYRYTRYEGAAAFFDQA